MLTALHLYSTILISGANNEPTFIQLSCWSKNKTIKLVSVLKTDAIQHVWKSLSRGNPILRRYSRSKDSSQIAGTIKQSEESFINLLFRSMTASYFSSRMRELVKVVCLSPSTFVFAQWHFTGGSLYWWVPGWILSTLW